MNIRKKQIKNLFNNFFNTIYDGIWFSGIKRYGKYKEWYKNGQLWKEANYNKKGELNGIHKKWWGNGQLNRLCHYKNNKLNNKYKKWNKNGNLIFEIEFKDNELIGIDYINPKYINGEYWFEYWDEYNKKTVNFYNKIKEMYNGKYKKKTN